MQVMGNLNSLTINIFVLITLILNTCHSQICPFNDMW